jgi:hypothetical protein
MYLYCTCRSEATSASVAHLLREQGFNAFVIVGGLAAWRRAGNPLGACAGERFSASSRLSVDSTPGA